MFSDQEISIIHDTLLNKKVVMIHSEDCNKTKIIYCIIAMRVLGIKSHVLIKEFEKINPWDPFCQKLNDVEIAQVRAYEFEIFKNDPLYLTKESIDSNLRSNQSNLSNQINQSNQISDGNNFKNDIDNIMMILGNNVEPGLIRDMLYAGMNTGDIINALI